MPYALFDSPIGPLTLVGEGDQLTALLTPDATTGAARMPVAQRHDQAAFADVQQQLREYFAGQRRSFALKLAPNGTAFQHSAWQALQAIPYGQTRSYADQAHALGNPAAVRAVGLANGKNPIAIIIPCHRVIGSNGALTGYAGGLTVKRWLLAFEAGQSPLPLA